MKKKQTTLLIVLDGWGVGDLNDKGNPITPKTAPNYFSWLKKYPRTTLKASGKSVGLVKGQEGNSEAGHLNIGAGRVVKQDTLYISDAIKDGTFFKNEAFDQAVHHLRKYKTSAHVMGLLSNHNSAHSCPEHLLALLTYLRRKKIKKVYLHLFTDGRDSGQFDATVHLKKLLLYLKPNEQVATIMGRLYAMDRNKNWERTKQAYNAMVNGQGRLAPNSEAALTLAYNTAESDEFISPTVVADKKGRVAGIKSNDALFFFNLRSDRARQLTKTFVQPNFEKTAGAFKRKNFPKNIRFVAMTDFGPDLPGIFTAFPSRDVVNSLGQVLCPLKQLYIAESEKFAHITYFLNGGYAKQFCDEKWIKIPSDPIKNFKNAPEMKTKAVAAFVIKAIKTGQYDFIGVNFASADMVGHTGNLGAAKIAISGLDKALGQLRRVIVKNNCQAIITADHGNAEVMINHKTGEVDSEHSNNLVPMVILASPSRLKELKLGGHKQLKRGQLADVAPTILKMMNIKKAKEMTGKPLY